MGHSILIGVHDKVDSDKTCDSDNPNSVHFNGELVLATPLPAWAPQVGWAFAFGARTGDRKDDHWLDDLRVQSGYLLDVGTVEFGVSLNGGADARDMGR